MADTNTEPKPILPELAPATPAPEVAPSPEPEKIETAVETTPEAKEPDPTAENEPISPEMTTPKKRPSVVIPQMRDEVTVRIEKIMEDGLGEAYQRLSPVAKQEFKIKGEETATKIRELLQNTHVKAKKILQLILEWLKLLPGVNRFFLEQEAKIKTDRIIGLKK